MGEESPFTPTPMWITAAACLRGLSALPGSHITCVGLVQLPLEEKPFPFIESLSLVKLTNLGQFFDRNFLPSGNAKYILQGLERFLPLPVRLMLSRG